MTIWPEKLRASEVLVRALGEAAGTDPQTIRRIEMDFNDSCIPRGRSATTLILDSGERITVDEAVAERIISGYQVRTAEDGVAEVIIPDGREQSDITSEGIVIGTAANDDDYYTSLVKIPRLLC